MTYVRPNAICNETVEAVLKKKFTRFTNQCPYARALPLPLNSEYFEYVYVYTCRQHEPWKQLKIAVQPLVGSRVTNVLMCNDARNELEWEHLYSKWLYVYKYVCKRHRLVAYDVVCQSGRPKKINTHTLYINSVRMRNEHIQKLYIFVGIISLNPICYYTFWKSILIVYAYGFGDFLQHINTFRGVHTVAKIFRTTAWVKLHSLFFQKINSKNTQKI